MSRSKLFKYISEVLGIVFGCALYAVGVAVFIEPSNITPGGATGLAVILNRFFDAFPVGLYIILLNLPLLVLSFFVFDLKFVLKTTFTTVFSSILIDVFAKIFPPFSSDMILSALAGGVSCGAGLAVIMLFGATTGGTEMLAKIIHKKRRYISVGTMMIAVDAAIVALSAIIYNDFEISLYSVLCIITMSLFLDKMIYGLDRGKMFFIITEKNQKMLEVLVNESGRGVTEIKALGGYTKAEKHLLICVVRPPEVSKILSIVKTCDENAFITVTEVGEVMGRGFKRIAE